MKYVLVGIGFAVFWYFGLQFVQAGYFGRVLFKEKRGPDNGDGEEKE